MHTARLRLPARCAAALSAAPAAVGPAVEAFYSRDMQDMKVRSSSSSTGWSCVLLEWVSPEGLSLVQPGSLPGTNELPLPLLLMRFVPHDRIASLSC